MTSDEDLYKQTLEQYNDPGFARQYAANIEERIDERLFDKFLPLVSAGGTVLDIACAAGRDSGYIKSRGFKATGIDYSHELLAIATQKFPDITFVEGDFTLLPFADASFDGIWCKAALVHLPSQTEVKRALHEFWRVLKPGGAILIRTKARQEGEAATAVRTDKLSSKKRYFRFQGQHEFSRLMEVTGFKVLECWVENEQSAGQHSVKRDENWLTIIAKKEKP